MEGLSAFLDMGGYGAFVWPAYGITAFVLLALLVISRGALARSEATLTALEGDGRETTDEA
jgi:heme exporter protein D